MTDLDATGALATALNDARLTSRLSEHPEDVAALREEAAGVLAWLPAGWELVHTVPDDALLELLREADDCLRIDYSIGSMRDTIRKLRDRFAKLEVETIERCAKVAERAVWGWQVYHPEMPRGMNLDVARQVRLATKEQAK